MPAERAWNRHGNILGTEAQLLDFVVSGELTRFGILSPLSAARRRDQSGIVGGLPMANETDDAASGRKPGVAAAAWGKSNPTERRTRRG